MLSLSKLSTGKAVVLACLLHACSVQGASLPRHHRLRGGEAEERQPAVYPPSSDMIKALEYIESLKQRTDGGREREKPTRDYDEVQKFRILLQLASLQGEGTPERQSSPPAQRQQDIPAEQLVRALLRTLQEQPASPPRPALVVPGNDRRAHKHPSANTGSPVNAPAYGGFPRPHKKYPLMFEDEENRDSAKRATEELNEKYTPQSLTNLRSIFQEQGKLSTSNSQKRGIFDDVDDLFSLRNLAYEDVAGGEEWIPVEENVETEDVVNRRHEEFDRALQNYDEEEEEEGDGMQMQRRASQNKEDPEEDTKLVDYYLLKILGMSKHETAKRQAGEQIKRVIRHPLVDPQALNELLEISLKLHIPPEDLIDMLITEEIRKLDHHPQASPRYRTSSKPKIRYYSRRLPVKNAPEDMDEENFLNIIEMETISNDYPVSRRPLKSASAPPRVLAPLAPARILAPAPPPAVAPKVPASSGRRENIFMSELNKMPFKRESDNDDEAEEDEMITFLAAKILTKYPSTISKRDTQSQAMGQFPYELYEQAMKDYFDQADSEKAGTMTKRDSEGNEEVVEPMETQVKDEVPQETEAPETKNEEE
ncbi:unnamed protein product [Coregonus sp. 'balchen']|nr:unnamed protein product [Coregonus sp. 'balchen']